MVRFICLIVLLTSCATAPDPATPDGALRQAVTALADGDARTLWDSLPASYQRDIAEVVREFAAHSEPEEYDRAFALAARYARALREKRSLVFEMVPPEQRADVARVWDPALDAIDALVDSDLASIERARTIDVDSLVERAGEPILAWIRLTQGIGRDELRRVADLSFETTEQRDKIAALRVSSPEFGTTHIAVIKVDGRWVPLDLARKWQPVIDKLRAGIRRTGGNSVFRSMFHTDLDTAEARVSALERAETAPEVAQALSRGMAARR